MRDLNQQKRQIKTVVAKMSVPKCSNVQKSKYVMSIKKIVFLALVAMCTPLSGVLMAETTTRMQPCPSSPNCVCSDATDEHAIAPLKLASDPQQTWQKLQEYLTQQTAYTVKQSEDGYIKAEAKTRLLRFVDDLEFELRTEAGVIAVRSASRVGYSDLGANRRRIEKIRRAVEED